MAIRVLCEGSGGRRRGPAKAAIRAVSGVMVSGAGRRYAGTDSETVAARDQVTGLLFPGRWARDRRSGRRLRVQEPAVRVRHSH